MARALSGRDAAGDSGSRQEQGESPRALVTAAEDPTLSVELTESTAESSWNTGRFSSLGDLGDLGDLVDRGVAEGQLGPAAPLLEWLRVRRAGQAEQPGDSMLGGAVEGVTRPIWRLCFLGVLGTDPDAWIAVLGPATIALRSSALADQGLLEFLVRGVEFLLSGGTIEPPRLESLLVEAGAESALPDLLLALRALRNPSVLQDVAPERRTATLDFLVKAGRPVDLPVR